MKKFHAAINFVPSTGRNILVRLKELGNNAPTLKLDKSVFGDTPPVNNENFVLEVDGGFLQSGNYLLATGNCKVLNREVQEAQVFDVDAYMDSLNDDPVSGDNTPQEPSF